MTGKGLNDIRFQAAFWTYVPITRIGDVEFELDQAARTISRQNNPCAHHRMWKCAVQHGHGERLVHVPGAKSEDRRDGRLLCPGW